MLATGGVNGGRDLLWVDSCKDERVVSQVREWATALVAQELPLHFCIHIPLIVRVLASRTCSY